MNLVAEHEHGAFRVRVTDCGCGQPDCDQRFMYATTHRALWLAIGACSTDEQEPFVNGFLLDARLDPRIMAVVAQGIALIGLVWPFLTASRGMVLRQMEAFSDLPEWMHGVPLHQVWAVRGVVFGDDLSRVPLALEAVEQAYVQERPAVRRG